MPETFFDFPTDSFNPKRLQLFLQTDLSLVKLKKQSGYILLHLFVCHICHIQVETLKYAPLSKVSCDYPFKQILIIIQGHTFSYILSQGQIAILIINQGQTQNFLNLVKVKRNLNFTSSQGQIASLTINQGYTLSFTFGHSQTADLIIGQCQTLALFLVKVRQ